MSSEPALRESCSSKRVVVLIFFQLFNRFLSFRTIRKGGFFHGFCSVHRAATFSHTVCVLAWKLQQAVLKLASSLTFSVHSCDLPLLIQGINPLFCRKDQKKEANIGGWKMCCSSQAGQETNGVFVQGWGPLSATGHRPQPLLSEQRTLYSICVLITLLFV